MTQRLSTQLTALVTDIGFLTEAANAANLAYVVSTGGDPASYEPFGSDAVDDVLNNLPPVRAVLNASLDIAANARGGGDDVRLEVLQDIADGNLDDDELLTVRLYMNAVWWQRNADRDLARTGRDICKDYAELLDPFDAEEVAKDDHLMVAVAKTIVEKLND